MYTLRTAHRNPPGGPSRAPRAIWAVGAPPFWTSWAQSSLSWSKLYKGRPVRARVPPSRHRPHCPQAPPILHGSSWPMIHCRHFHVRPSEERHTDGPSKPPSPWTRPPQGSAWPCDSTTAVGACPHPPRLLQGPPSANTVTADMSSSGTGRAPQLHGSGGGTPKAAIDAMAHCHDVAEGERSS
jgi:hypothetical protein